jgi:hypothetical protein
MIEITSSDSEPVYIVVRGQVSNEVYVQSWEQVLERVHVQLRNQIGFQLAGRVITRLANIHHQVVDSET